MIYQFETGEKVEVQDFEVPAELFKVNLPDCLEGYESGNGEGVWACGDADTFNAWNSDVKEGIYYVKILNDSVYYPELKCYTVIPVEMRGENRPVAIYNELHFKYGNSHKEEVMTKVLK